MPEPNTKQRFTLVIGNKNYSTWSLRAWLLMRAANIPFTEIILPLDNDEFERRIGDYSPSRRVPVLNDGSFAVWDTLAIAEYLAEQYPDKDLWPTDIKTRAYARAICAEMHSGFADLRRELPMNLRRSVAKVPIDSGAQRDIDRICEIWRNCRHDFGAAGPFLFGGFTIADAFYAPVATRLRTYAVAIDEACQSYVDTIYGLPAFQEWHQAAKAEKWIIAADER